MTEEEARSIFEHATQCVRGALKRQRPNRFLAAQFMRQAEEAYDVLGDKDPRRTSTLQRLRDRVGAL